MSSGRRDFERAAGNQLPAYVGEVYGLGSRSGLRNGRFGSGFVTERNLYDVPEVAHRSDIATRNCSCLPGRGGRDQTGKPEPLGNQRGTKPAARRSDRSVQGQLTERDDVAGGLAGQTTGDEYPEGDRQVVGGPSFREIGRCQVDGQSDFGEAEAAACQCRQHPLTCFPDGRVRQANNGHGAAAAFGVDLDVYRSAIDANQGSGRY